MWVSTRSLPREFRFVFSISETIILFDDCFVAGIGERMNWRILVVDVDQVFPVVLVGNINPSPHSPNTRPCHEIGLDHPTSADDFFASLLRKLDDPRSSLEHLFEDRSVLRKDSVVGE